MQRATNFKTKNNITSEPQDINKQVKVENLTEIPLGYFFTLNPSKQSIKNNEFVTFLGMEDVSEEGKILKQHKIPYSKIRQGLTYFERDDVLVAKITPCFENGKGACLENLQTQIGFGSTEFHVLRANSNSVPKYIFYQTQSQTFRKKLELEMVGTAGQKRVSAKSILDFPLPLKHSKEEQKAIATALSDVDELINALDALIEKKRNIKQGTMQELLTGKRRLPGFSGEWGTKHFSELAFLSNERINPQKAGKEFKCIELEHLEQGTGRLLSFANSSDLLSQKTRFSKGDILFGKLRPYLKKYHLANFKGICSSEIWVIKTHKGVSNNFLLYLIQTNTFLEETNKTSGTKMPRANWHNLLKLEFSIPDQSEQNAIAQVLSDMDTEIEKLEQQRNKTKLLKQGMMQELLTGKTRLL